MGVLKIKVNNTGDVNTDWETIDSLNLTSSLSAGSAAITGNLTVGVNNGTSSITLNGKNLQAVIEDSAVTVYIHVNTSAEADGTYNLIDNKTYSTLMSWFNVAYPANSEERKKAIKGFLIEHRTIGSTTYHLPYYWNNSSWVLLNAIWG